MRTVEKHEDGSDADQGQQRWIDHGADDVAAQIVAGALKLGQAFENGRERARSFARADHINV
jgi:hypothetical protein